MPRSEAVIEASRVDPPRPNGKGPLAGYRVLDLGQVIAAPLVATALADLGADVINVEHPSGDSVRRYGPVAPGSTSSLWWKVAARNKRCVTLDLSSDEGRETARALAGQADVLIESFRPGTLERWGLGPDDLLVGNPRLVVLRISGFGQEGPYSSRGGFGTVAEGMSGFAWMTGWRDRPPTLPSFGLGDAVTALTATSGVLAALLERERSGVGQVLDVALINSLINALGPSPTIYEHLGIQWERNGNGTPFLSPRGTYQCSDGHYLAISGATDQVTRRLFDLMGRSELADDPRFIDNPSRVKNDVALNEMVSDYLLTLTREEALTTLAAAGVVVGPVYSSAEVVNDVHLREWAFTLIDDEELGSLRIPDNPLRFSRTPVQMRHAGRGLGQDQDDVLSDWLGRDDEEEQA